MLPAEQWRPVAGTHNYLYVSNLGRVRSNWRLGRVLKLQKDKKGYLRIRVSVRDTKTTYKVHRLVAQAFIPNPDNLPQVNHIDGNKANNCVDNLEWMSNTDNYKHAIAHGLWANSFKSSYALRIPVYSIDVNTGERRDFISVAEAQRFFNTRHVSSVIHGKRRTAAGQRFYRAERG